MPYKDIEKQRAANRKTQKNAYLCRLTVRFKKNEPELYEGLLKAAHDSGVSPAEYCKTATVEKLIAQGYYQENQEQN